MFSIDVEPSRKLIRVSMSGFMDTAEVAAFLEQEQQAVIQMGCGSEGFLLLVSANDAVIQSKEVVAALTTAVQSAPLKASKIAVVRGSSLTRMQTQRIISIRDNAAIFCTLKDAEEWLFSVDVAGTRPDAATVMPGQDCRQSDVGHLHRRAV